MRVRKCVWLCQPTLNGCSMNQAHVMLIYSILCPITSLSQLWFSLGSEWSLCCHGDSRRVGFLRKQQGRHFLYRMLSMHENTHPSLSNSRCAFLTCCLSCLVSWTSQREKVQCQAAPWLLSRSQDLQSSCQKSPWTALTHRKWTAFMCTCIC